MNQFGFHGIIELQLTDEKHRLQQSIDNGEIETVAELQTWIWRRGWRLRLTERTSKRNQRILIVNPGVVRGFQVEVPFEVSGYEFQQPGIWIYGLLARTSEGKACYIGQSASIMRRLMEHHKRTRYDRGADALFRWSDKHEAKVYVVLLEFCKATVSKAETARLATLLEGSWLSAAIEAAYQAPGSEKWGQLPNSRDQLRSFRDNAVWKMAMPFDTVVKFSPPLKQFWLGNA